MSSSQKKPRRTVAAAPAQELWPEVCSGDPPMPPARGVQLESWIVFGLLSVLASRIAVPGLQAWKTNFVMNVGATASHFAMDSNAKRRADPESDACSGPSFDT